jgi:hypothetical protein
MWPELLFDLAAVQEGFTKTCSWTELRQIQADISAWPMSRLLSWSHKMEFSFLNSNLMAPASQLFTFKPDTFPTMEEHMFGESTQVLLFLAIVGLTVVSTIDLVMQPIKQEQDIDREH